MKHADEQGTDLLRAVRLECVLDEVEVKVDWLPFRRVAASTVSTIRTTSNLATRLRRVLFLGHWV